MGVHNILSMVAGNENETAAMTVSGVLATAGLVSVRLVKRWLGWSCWCAQRRARRWNVVATAGACEAMASTPSTSSRAVDRERGKLGSLIRQERVWAAQAGRRPCVACGA